METTRPMRLGIDASNLRSGGGVTHLVELLQATDPKRHRLASIVVWGGKATLSKIKARDWLIKVNDSLLDKSLPFRQYWKYFKLPKLAFDMDCDLLFAPGGSNAGTFHPFVTMSQNMLPFEWAEMRRYGFSWIFFRLMLLRWHQSKTFQKADGLIFLTEYARKSVMKIVRQLSGSSTIIPHGINRSFVCPPREQQKTWQYSKDRPFRILYISIVDFYKHQWHVVEAVTALRKSGLPVQLDLVGPAYPPALKRMNKILDQAGTANKCIRYHGSVSYEELPRWYQNTDIFVFASSCENMPNILLEAMAFGLPIACSNRGPMPEILGNAGVYFDPEKPNEIASAIKSLIDSPTLRMGKAQEAHRRAAAFSWERCADETFRFLRQIAQSPSNGNI